MNDSVPIEPLGRSFRIGLWVVLLITVTVCCGLWWIKYIDLADRLDTARRNWSGIAWIVREAYSLDQNLKAQEKAIQDRRLLISGTDLRASQQTLSENVKELLRPHVTQIGNIQNLPPRSLEGYTALPARIQFKASPSKLGQVLAALELSEPFIVLESFDALAERETAAGKVVLSVSVEVYGLTQVQPK